MQAAIVNRKLSRRGHRNQNKDEKDSINERKQQWSSLWIIIMKVKK
jgi:hypothetical protein